MGAQTKWIPDSTSKTTQNQYKEVLFNLQLNPIITETTLTTECIKENF